MLRLGKEHSYTPLVMECEGTGGGAGSALPLGPPEDTPSCALSFTGASPLIGTQPQRDYMEKLEMREKRVKDRRGQKAS